MSRSPSSLLRESLVALLCLTGYIYAQESADSLPKANQPSSASRPDTSSVDSSSIDKSYRDISISRLPKNIWLDQKSIWGSPAKLSFNDLNWAVPTVFLGAVVFGTDHSVMRRISVGSLSANRADSLSNYGAAAFAGMTAGVYLWGLHTHNERLRSTAVLSGEAVLQATAFTYGIKYIARRERPDDPLGNGRFFHGDNSFPSEHAAAAWALAAVVSKEYPGPLTKLLMYGGASGVSIARILAARHFPSDVVVGAALGAFVGQQVYSAHHPEDNHRYGTFERSTHEAVRNPSMMASRYVELDSWIYPAFSRLAAFGLLPDSLFGLRPWTRLECARLLQYIEQNQAIHAFDGSDQAKSLFLSLHSEFQADIALLNGTPNIAARVESVYTRLTSISGPPLTDEIHFAETFINDFGRPNREGFNNVTGTSMSAEMGPIGISIRGEYQHAPGAPPLSEFTQHLVDLSSDLPPRPVGAFPETNRARLLDSYVSLNLSDWQISAGKQSLWWGPGMGGDLMFTNNAEPLLMLRLSRVTPLKLSGFLKYLGPVRTDTFLAHVEGYHFLRLTPAFVVTGTWDHTIDPQPAIWGTKFNFKPTPNLELGVSVTTVFAGLGRPLTLETFKHTFSQHGNLQPQEPGDRRTGFDLSYRLPVWHRRITFYTSSMTEDESNPVAFPRRSAWNPGIYVSQVPLFPKIDFRVEGVYTDLPNLRPVAAFYTNVHYAGGYTNNGKILASWVGPEGRGLQAWSTFWRTPSQKFQVNYRYQHVNTDFIRGGNLNDYNARYEVELPNRVSLSAALQHERWNFPAIDPNHRSNTSVTLRLAFRPRLQVGH